MFISRNVSNIICIRNMRPTCFGVVAARLVGSWWSARSGNNANSAFVEKPDDPDAASFDVIPLSGLVKDKRVAVAHFNCQVCRFGPNRLTWCGVRIDNMNIHMCRVCVDHSC